MLVNHRMPLVEVLIALGDSNSDDGDDAVVVAAAAAGDGGDDENDDKIKSKAREYFEEALAIVECSVGYDDDDDDASLLCSAMILQRLGKLLASKQEYDEAVKMFERALAVYNCSHNHHRNRCSWKRVNNDDISNKSHHHQHHHQQELGDVNFNLGKLYFKIGKTEASQPFLQSAVSFRLLNYGPDHVKTVQAREELELVTTVLTATAAAAAKSRKQSTLFAKVMSSTTPAPSSSSSSSSSSPSIGKRPSIISSIFASK